MMRVLAIACLAMVAASSCARSTARSAADVDTPTVLRVENQGFDDRNIFVLPEGGARVRLGTATGKSTAHFTLPRHVVPRGVRGLRFIAAPIATRGGEASEEILVTPGDTVMLIIPPA